MLQQPPTNYFIFRPSWEKTQENRVIALEKADQCQKGNQSNYLGKWQNYNQHQQIQPRADLVNWRSLKDCIRNETLLPIIGWCGSKII